MVITIGEKQIGADAPVFIMAEAGINHDGEISKARELVLAAAEAGADAVKFQTHLAEHEMLPVSDKPVYLDESLFDLIKRVGLSLDDHLDLMERAGDAGIIFLSTPFSIQAVDLLEKIHIPAFKIGSGELSNIPFLKYVAARQKPVLLSTGMSRMEEVRFSVSVFKEAGCPFALFQCTSEYPTPPEHTGLNVIQKYKEEFQVPVGFSDHSADNYSAFAAVALGAKMVEKHFTISRQWPGPDQTSSIEPDQLSDLVKGIRVIEKGLETKAKEMTESEVDVRKIFSASIVTISGIKAGDAFTADNIWVKRPGTGIPANELMNVIGRKAAKNLEKNTILSGEDIL